MRLNRIVCWHVTTTMLRRLAPPSVDELARIAKRSRLSGMRSALLLALVATLGFGGCKSGPGLLFQGELSFSLPEGGSTGVAPGDWVRIPDERDAPDDAGLVGHCTMGSVSTSMRLEVRSETLEPNALRWVDIDVTRDSSVGHITARLGDDIYEGDCPLGFVTRDRGRGIVEFGVGGDGSDACPLMGPSPAVSELQGSVLFDNCED